VAFDREVSTATDLDKAHETQLASIRGITGQSLAGLIRLEAPQAHRTSRHRCLRQRAASHGLREAQGNPAGSAAAAATRRPMKV